MSDDNIHSLISLGYFAVFMIGIWLWTRKEKD
jgi:hypothetical protein